MTKRSAFRYFKTSPEIIRLAEMLYIRMCAYSKWKWYLDVVAVKINIDFIPQNLSAAETDRLVEFLRGLTGTRGINGRLGRPARVPSGVRVD